MLRRRALALAAGAGATGRTTAILALAAREVEVEGALEVEATKDGAGVGPLLVSGVVYSLPEE